MKVLDVSYNQIISAKKLYKFKELNNSITAGKSNIYGALGEVCVRDYFSKKSGYAVDHTATYDYDMIINGSKIDVKTKKTKVLPESHYLCSIAAYNTNQECDFYFFVRISESLNKCYLLGYMNKEEFFSQSVFKRKGDMDINGWRFKADCYNMEIGNINRFK